MGLEHHALSESFSGALFGRFFGAWNAGRSPCLWIAIGWAA